MTYKPLNNMSTDQMPSLDAMLQMVKEFSGKVNVGPMFNEDILNGSWDDIVNRETKAAGQEAKHVEARVVATKLGEPDGTVSNLRK